MSTVNENGFSFDASYGPGAACRVVCELWADGTVIALGTGTDAASALESALWDALEGSC